MTRAWCGCCSAPAPPRPTARSRSRSTSAGAAEMLIGAGVRFGGQPMRTMGGAQAGAIERARWGGSGDLRNFHAGEATVVGGAGISALSGYPEGGLPPGSWSLPNKPGGMSSRYEANFSLDATGLAVGGITATGAASFVIDVATATGGLIASGSGAASFTITLAGELFGVLQGAGAASFTVDTNAPILGAEASMIGSAAWALTA